MKKQYLVRAFRKETFENLPNFSPKIQTRYERWKQMSTLYGIYRFFKVGLASEAELEKMANEPEGIF